MKLRKKFNIEMKILEKTQVYLDNLQTPWPRTWYWNNFLEKKSKPIIKLYSQLNQFWIIKLEKMPIKKRTKNYSQSS